MCFPLPPYAVGINSEFAHCAPPLSASGGSNNNSGGGGAREQRSAEQSAAGSGFNCEPDPRGCEEEGPGLRRELRTGVVL